jgi:hypothetical protein
MNAVGSYAVWAGRPQVIDPIAASPLAIVSDRESLSMSKGRMVQEASIAVVQEMAPGDQG